MLSVIFILICGAACSIMDTLAHHFSKSVFSKLRNTYWDASISWQNKYIDLDKSKGIRKFFNFIPIPVFLTDGWHLFKSILILSAFLAAYFYEPITNIFLLDLIILRTEFGIVFTILYKYALTRPSP